MTSNVEKSAEGLSSEELSQTNDELMAKQLSALYPIHWNVWTNCVKQLELILNSSQKVLQTNV